VAIDAELVQSFADTRHARPALSSGASLARCHDFDPKDQMECYCRWWQEGYLSCTGRCFDIGGTVNAALSRYTETGDPFSGSVDPRSAGNGSLMRLAPVPLAYRVNPYAAGALPEVRGHRKADGRGDMRS
jgi:ADP-ribosylglycohydrolase